MYLIGKQLPSVPTHVWQEDTTAYVPWPHVPTWLANRRLNVPREPDGMEVYMDLSQAAPSRE